MPSFTRLGPEHPTQTPYLKSLYKSQISLKEQVLLMLKVKKKKKKVIYTAWPLGSQESPQSSKQCILIAVSLRTLSRPAHALYIKVRFAVRECIALYGASWCIYEAKTIHS